MVLEIGPGPVLGDTDFTVTQYPILDPSATAYREFRRHWYVCKANTGRRFQEPSERGRKDAVHAARFDTADKRLESGTIAALLEFDGQTRARLPRICSTLVLRDAHRVCREWCENSKWVIGRSLRHYYVLDYMSN